MKNLKVLICPDSFKGSISAHEFCDHAKKVLRKIHPHLKVATRPLADGGEHTLDCILPYLDRPQLFWVDTYDPLMRKIKAPFLISNDVAYIEMAKTSGLQLIDEEQRDVLHATSFGTGLLIKDAIERGIKKIILFCGGTATNDAGFGIASALDVEFYSDEGVISKPIPIYLNDVIEIDIPNKYPEVELVVATDVRNVLCGETGASFIYGPQKGASYEDVLYLDDAIFHYSGVIQRYCAKDVRELPGCGAAGGAAASLVGFFNAKIVSATSILFKLMKIKEKINQADVIITGEGKFDRQSINGKLVINILDQCHDLNKRAIVIAGKVDQFKMPYKAEVIQLMPQDKDEKYAKDNVYDLLEKALLQLKF